MLWVEPTDPDGFAAVAGVLDLGPGDDPETDVYVAQALTIASELLTLATGFRVHPAGEITEESQAMHLTRLNPVYGPLTEVVSLVRVEQNGAERPVGYRRVGNAVQVSTQSGVYGSTPLWRTNWNTGSQGDVYRLTYRFASTVTPLAQVMVLHYARQFFLWLTGDENECDLPENVTSIDREGLGITLATPQDFLDRGRTGLAKIDTWLSQVNAKRSLRPSQVFTPDAPPGVGVSLRRLP